LCEVLAHHSVTGHIVGGALPEYIGDVIDTELWDVSDSVLIDDSRIVSLTQNEKSVFELAQARLEAEFHVLKVFTWLTKVLPDWLGEMLGSTVAPPMAKL
jgi:hypothetical protein